MDGIIRYFNNQDGGGVDLFSRRERVTTIVSDMMNEEDRVTAELELAGNKIKRISNKKNIVADIILSIGGAAFCCSGVVLNLMSVCFCTDPNDTNAHNEDGSFPKTAGGTSLCIAGGMMFGSGMASIWAHLNKRDELIAEKQKIEARLAAIERRTDIATMEHAEHYVNVQRLVSNVMQDPDVSGVPPMPIALIPFEPPSYSEINEPSARRQLFPPQRQELPSISELPEYGDHTGDRLLEAGMMPR